MIVALVRHERFAQPLHGAGCVAVAHAHERGAQTIISNDDPAAPGISVEVDDVDAVHSAAVERGLEIAYALRDEEWGVRRFMLREPSGTIVNVLSHRSD